MLLSLLLITAGAVAQLTGMGSQGLRGLRATAIASVGVATARGQVTCVLNGLFYVQDETDAFPVYYDYAATTVAPGDVIEMKCERRSRLKEMVLAAIEIHKVETRALPEPIDTTIDAVIRGEHLHRRVRVKGSVHDIASNDHTAVLMVDGTASSLSVRIPTNGTRPDELLDADVAVTGIALAGSHAKGTERLWADCPLNSPDDVVILKQGDADPFTRPEVTLADVTRNAVPATTSRYRFTATVTYASHSGWFYVLDGKGFAARCRKPDGFNGVPALQRKVFADPKLYPGDVLEVVGQLNPRSDIPGQLPWWIQCEWRVIRHDPAPAYARVSISEIYGASYDGKPVSVIGRIESIDEPKTDPFNGFLNYSIGLKGFSALVQLPEKCSVPFQEGDAVRMRGVVKSTFDHRTGAVSSVRINVQSFDDMERSLIAIDTEAMLKWAGGIAAGLLLVAVWIVSLRRQVRHQTSKLVTANDELLRFKQVADVSTDCIAMATLENRPIYINPAGRRMLGIAQDADLATVTYEETSTPEGRAQIANGGMAHAMEHGFWKTELTMRRLNGDVFPVSFLGLVIRSAQGHPIYIASVARDISERCALEQELRESNSELKSFKAIAETSSDLMALGELDLTITYLNPAGRDLLGIARDVPSSSILFEQIFSEESKATFHGGAFAYSFEHGAWTGDAVMVHRDGHDIPVSFVGLVLKGDDGRPAKMACVARDISAQRRLEGHLRQSLEHERDLNQMKSGFVNMISHEFRTPLGMILFASTLLQRPPLQLSEVERAEQFQTIDAAVERMNDLIEQTLSLGRAETTAPKTEALDVLGLLRQLIDELLSATSHRSPVTLNACEQLPQAFGDAAMLRAILGNLISNAIKYSPPGSPVMVTLELDGDDARITVRDSGSGIPEQDMPHLFTVFSRGSNTTGIPGTGLGLAIVKRCTDAMGGTVRARNVDGGAEFIVALPLFKSRTP